MRHGNCPGWSVHCVRHRSLAGQMPGPETAFIGSSSRRESNTYLGIVNQSITLSACHDEVIGLTALLTRLAIDFVMSHWLDNADSLNPAKSIPARWHDFL